MEEIDSKVRDEVGARYRRLRTRYWQCLLLGPAIGLVLMAGGDRLGKSGSETIGLSLNLFGGLCFLGSCLAGMIIWMKIMRFRCPRCGKLFVMSMWSTWPTDRCKHCRLDLGPAQSGQHS